MAAARLKRIQSRLRERLARLLKPWRTGALAGGSGAPVIGWAEPGRCPLCGLATEAETGLCASCSAELGRTLRGTPGENPASLN